MQAFIEVETRVPLNHPLRISSAFVNAAVAELSPPFDELYAADRAVRKAAAALSAEARTIPRRARTAKGREQSFESTYEAFAVDLEIDASTSVGRASSELAPRRAQQLFDADAGRRAALDL